MSGRGRVLVSGGGAAGLSLAACGMVSSPLVERRPTLNTGGYAIDIRGAAMDVADRMGVGDAVRRADINTPGMSYVDETGKVLVNVKTEHLMSAEGDVEIQRGDLNRLLLEASTDGTEFVFGGRDLTLPWDPDNPEARLVGGRS